MKIEQLLSDTLTEHEHLAPNADEILADVQRRLDRPRTAGWPVAVAAAAVLVAGTGVGVVALRPSHQTGHASTIQSAAKGPSAPAAPSIAALTMPFDVGWLPAGPANYIARRINVGGVGDTSAASFDGEYLLEVSTTAGKLDVDVQQMPGDLTGIGFKSGAGVHITVNGRPAIESRNSNGPGGYEVYFQDAAGGVIYVNVANAPGQHVAVNQLVADGRQVAAGVRFPGTTKVNPTFGVGYVPTGLKVVAFDVEQGMSAPELTTSYDIGSPTSQTSAAQVTSGSVSAPSGTVGHTVQGHPTRYSVDHGYTEFYILNAVHGAPLMIGSTLPLAEIYRIADGLVLPR